MFGTYIVLLSLFTACGSITSANLFPYGPSYDNPVPSGDDVSKTVNINMFGPGLPFFGQTSKTLTVSTNGILSLDGSYSGLDFTEAFPNPDGSKLIAPFYADAYTSCSNCGAVYYRQTTTSAQLSTANSYVHQYFPSQSSFRASWLFIATWDHVAYYGCDQCPTSTCGQILNTFQCALISDGTSTFAMFLYEDINWTSGTAISIGDACTGLGGYPAQVGFSNGDSTNYLNIPESRTANVLDVNRTSNVLPAVPGLYMFQIDSLPANHCSGRCTGSVCANTLNSYTCQNQCSPNPCENGGQCSTVSSSTYHCQCPANYTGTNCQTLNPCRSNPCMNGGSCIADAHGYTFSCACPATFTGTYCESVDLCFINTPCQNGGTCTMHGNTTACRCTAGYSGMNCETPTCFPNPCQNGGTCNIVGSSSVCSCPDGYSGANCQVDACSPNPCIHGICSHAAGGYSCTCYNGYSGPNCQVNACSPDPCIHGTCSHTAGGYSCTCFNGYSGLNCQVDACSPDPCIHGTCLHTAGGYFCSCFSGYTGSNCQTPAPQSPCSPDPCAANGICRATGSTFDCDCFNGYTGVYCQTPPDECTPDPCKQGICHPTASSYYCSCFSGYTGLTCSTYCGLTCGGYGLLRSASGVMTVTLLLCKLLLHFA